MIQYTHTLCKAQDQDNQHITIHKVIFPPSFSRVSDYPVYITFCRWVPHHQKVTQVSLKPVVSGIYIYLYKNK